MANESTGSHPNPIPRAESPEDAAFLALHDERERVERDLVLANQRQLYGQDAESIARAGADEAALLADLDRVMTQLRAAEYRRQPGAKRW